MFFRKRKLPYGTWEGREIKDDDEGRRALMDRLQASLAELRGSIDTWTTQHAFDACITALLFILKNAKFGA